jgi:hypothetical protein
MTCTGSGIARPGQYTNLAVATGATAVGERVRDSDPSNYFGVASEIHLEKSTNGDEADAAPGPAIHVGDPVTWTLHRLQHGNSQLSAIAVTDDRGVAVSCPSATLAVGAEMECTATGTATLGQYENTGTVAATDTAGNRVTDSDPSHYFASCPGWRSRSTRTARTPTRRPAPASRPARP